MSAINEFITGFTEKYHQIGHPGNVVDQMMDTVSGMGHRIEFGHDIQGLISAYHLDGIQGIGEWFDHMAKDFSSFAGIPLPFAEAIQNITGMQTDEAIEWLTVNAADIIEIGTEAAILGFFKNNPKAFKHALAIGTIWGFIDDNPLLIAMNAILYMRKLKKEGRLQGGFWVGVDHFTRSSFGVIDKVCTYTFLTDIGLSIFGMNLADMVGHGIDLLGLGADLTDTAHYATDIASSAADIVDGVASLGMAFLASKLIKKGFEWFNSDVKNELEKILPLASYKKQFNTLIHKNAPPESLMPVIEMMEQNGIYQPIL